MRAAALLLTGLLTACSVPGADPAPLQQVPVAPSEPVQEIREQVSATVVPVVVSVREAVQDVVPEPVAPPAPAQPDPAIAHAVRLIVRWEVTSRAYYEKRLTGVICPGGASGPTWGLGWDGGHQTRRTNAEAWAAHPDVERLADTSGKTGSQCRPSMLALTGVRTPYAMAEVVFASHALPSYMARTERKYGPGIHALSAGARGALYSETYNRGGPSQGDRGAEQRHIRDVCIPNADNACVARSLRAMCRLWVSTVHDPGLCNRRTDEANTALIPDRSLP